MEAINSICARRMQDHAGLARIEALAAMIAAGWRAVSGWIADFAASQRRAQACRELHRLDDHFLKDIGLDRRQIDQMFR